MTSTSSAIGIEVTKYGANDTGTTSYGVPASSMIGARGATSKPFGDTREIFDAHARFMADPGAPKKAY